LESKSHFSSDKGKPDSSKSHKSLDDQKERSDPRSRMKKIINKGSTGALCRESYDDATDEGKSTKEINIGFRRN